MKYHGYHKRSAGTGGGGDDPAEVGIRGTPHPEVSGNKDPAPAASFAPSSSSKTEVSVVQENGSAPELTVSRAATMGDVIKAQLSNESESIRRALWPIAAAQADEAAMAAILRNNDPRFPQSYFQRSTAKPLDRVLAVTYAPLPTSSANGSDAVGEGTWRAAAAGSALPPSFFDDKLVLSATLQADPADANMEVRRLVLPYDPSTFGNDVLDSFRNNRAKAIQGGTLEGVDVTVEVLNKAAYVTTLTMVVITAASSNGRHDQALEVLFPRLFGPDSAPAPLTQASLLDHPVDMYQMGSPMSERHDAFNLASTEYEGTLKDPASVEGFFRWLQSAVLAASDPGSSNVQAHFRLLPDDAELYANVVVFEVKEEERRLGLTAQEIEALPRFPASPPTGLVEVDATSPVRETSNAEEGPPAKTRRLEARASPPGLEGIDCLQKGQADYDKVREQYASFAGSYPTEDFEPFLIAQPKDASEIARIVGHAIDHGKRVVTRSGGHQYCGFSSGDQNYVQILMGNMQDAATELSTEPAAALKDRGCSIVSPDKAGMQWFVSVAPRCVLKELSATLVQNKLTVPHGECPLVGIGGHVQTGGYGHQMRGLGLCLDYVYSFDIVLCTARTDGSGPVAARKVTVYRPELRLSDDQSPDRDRDLNDDLYKGVLGGSPGAFGVITHIKFLAIHDDDPAYSQSRNVQGVYVYRGPKIDVGAAHVVRTMLKFASPSCSPKLCDGLDVFVTIVSADFWLLDALIVPELAYTGSNFTNEVKEQMDEILNACRAAEFWGLLGGTRFPFGQGLVARPPSAVAHTGVRTDGRGVTKGGREFDHPYRKRVNIMLDTDALSDRDAEDFVQGFGELAAQVVDDPDLHLVIQMNLGGGRVLTNDPEGRTGIPYRNQSFGFVFDVFYLIPAAEARATAIQSEMQKLLDRVGGGTCFNHRLFWGSFGREKGETDMSQATVQTLYYGNESAYRAMQTIKDKLDPNGVFTTEFTVQNS